ncbi:uncharacterized protein K452DRAFT_232760 [Aplosporella prunicola CBS 121167]|uniref:Carboxylic ester hydrolase n=1 Tax=Aplosporella prunicola CBS 121167 TaxID=1176127 RepID=A0A6A6B622_9PEZI|nr:uncharacterized protein K452DRAFT_232760 [Aplosporella prunicola CBS 121167]KAF2139460.1 hypothetical protein K452DRAFT_232760 [Aplosporella prunicola CBS 121167]
MNSTSPLSQLCSPVKIPNPTLFGAEILNLSANLVTNYSSYAPEQYNYNHPSIYADGLDFCNITVTYTHPGENDTINVETWLPLKWNERLQAVGGGGTVAGRFMLSYIVMNGAIAEGYATVTTDAGLPTDLTSLHSPLLSPGNTQLYEQLNFGSVSLNDEAIIAKSLIKSFYGRPQRYSYWSGCSQGGRQGFTLAQRYPTAYDGIVASAPAMNTPRFAPSLYYPQLVMNQLGRYPRNCELNAITEAAISACDKDDGVTDGVISDPASCDFDPLSVVGKVFNCSDTGSNMKISHDAAVVANATWSGPFSHLERRIWYGLEKGTIIAGSNGETTGIASTTCSSNGTCTGTLNQGSSYLQGYVAKDPIFDVTNVTLKEYTDMIHFGIQQFDAFTGSNDPDLTAFREVGGKILSYHGLSDPIIPPGGSRHYYDTVSEVIPEVHDFYRLFEVPGLSHCSGGMGGQPTTIFDQMVAWVENGTVPDTIPVNFKDGQGKTQNRILCPYPQKAQFNSTCGDSSKAECFHCSESA